MQASYGRSRYIDGLPPGELYGVAQRDATHRWKWKGKRRILVAKADTPHRTPEGAQRRHAKRMSRLQGVTLKSYLRRCASLGVAA